VHNINKIIKVNLSQTDNITYTPCAKIKSSTFMQLEFSIQ